MATSKIDEGAIFLLLKQGIRMRSLQRQNSRVTHDLKATHEAEIVFDSMLDDAVDGLDGISTNRVIRKMDEASLARLRNLVRVR